MAGRAVIEPSFISELLRDARIARVQASRGGGAGGEKEDPRLKEERTALRKMASEATPKELEALVPILTKAGIDPSGYQAIAGVVTPEERAENLMGGVDGRCA